MGRYIASRGNHARRIRLCANCGNVKGVAIIEGSKRMMCKHFGNMTLDMFCGKWVPCGEYVNEVTK